MRQVLWGVLLFALLGFIGTIYHSMTADDVQHVGTAGRAFVLAAVLSAGGIFISWVFTSRLTKPPSTKPIDSAPLAPSAIHKDLEGGQSLSARIAWALVWFGGAGVITTWCFSFVLGSSPQALAFVAKLCFAAGLAGLACFAVLRVVRAWEKHEPWVADVQSGAGAVRLGLMGWVQYVFNFSGTVSRRGFLVSQLVAGLIQIVCILWLMETPGTLLPWLLILASAIGMLAFGAKRTRDTGVSHWWFLLVLVPALNLAVLAFLFLVPTDEFKGRGL